MRAMLHEFPLETHYGEAGPFGGGKIEEISPK